MYNVSLGASAALLYAISGGLIGFRLSRGGQGYQSQLKIALLLVALLAVGLHSVLLYRQIAVPGGMNLGFFNALSLAGWLAALILVLAALAEPVENLGVVLLPFSAATILLALAFPSERLITGPDRAMQAHIVLSVLAYSLLTIAAVQALLLYFLDRQLHRRRVGALVRALPPLVTMEHLLFQMIAGGFVLLSLALLSGFLFLEDILAQRLVHKTTLSIAAWVVFGVLLWGRWRYGWRGRTAIRFTLSGFSALLLAYFGTKLVLELILRR